MNSTNNGDYGNLWVCSAHWCIKRYLRYSSSLRPGSEAFTYQLYFCRINGNRTRFSPQLSFNILNIIKVKLILLTGHVTCHVTSSGKQPLFEELVAVFSNIIPLKRVLDGFNYFLPLTLGMTVPLFTEKNCRVKGRLFQQKLKQIQQEIQL